MSTTALSAALSGLRTTQKALDVTASNISNAGVEGYTKKSLSQESITAGGIGVGVRFGEVQRYVNEYVQRDYRSQLGKEAFYSTSESYLSRIIALHGATDAQSNVGAQLSKLYDGFVSLSGSPDSGAIQSSIVAQATATVKSLNTLSRQMLEMRNEASAQLKSEVNDINLTLQNLANLNRKIENLAGLGQSTAAVEDQRDVLVKKIAEQLDVTYYKDGNNVLVLQTKDGNILADIDAREIAYRDENLTFGSLYPDNVGGLIIRGRGGEEADVDLAARTPGGRIGALLDVRDNTVPVYMAQLDELAHKLMVRFDDQGVRLFTDHTGAVPANSPNAYVGLANSIQVNEYVVTDPTLLQKGTSGVPVNAGSNSVIMNVINYTFGRTKDAAGTLNTAFNTSGLGSNAKLKFNIINDLNAGLLQFATSMLDSQAADYNSVKTASGHEKQYTQEIQTRLLESSAVNSDEELGRMIELQKSYSANAKMLGALDELFRDLLNAI